VVSALWDSNSGSWLAKEQKSRLRFGGRGCCSWTMRPGVVIHIHMPCSYRHRRTPLTWCLARRGWNLKTWCKIHWSDESRFQLHVTDGRMRVWRHKMTLLDLSPTDFRRFLHTSIGQPVLFEYGTGCEWHPSNQTLQCPVVTIRCYPWSVGSWQVFHIVGLCEYIHKEKSWAPLDMLKHNKLH
jgi:hypothetical protein